MIVALSSDPKELEYTIDLLVCMLSVFMFELGLELKNLLFTFLSAST